MKDYSTPGGVEIAFGERRRSEGGLRFMKALADTPVHFSIHSLTEASIH
jgi:hypothetical protein